MSPPARFRKVTVCRASVVSRPEDMVAMTLPYRFCSRMSAFCRIASSARAARSFSERNDTMKATP